MPGSPLERLYRRACALDVGVRKPGNVSLASAGHGMDAALFLAAAQASAGPLCRPGARVGERIEDAVAASWAAAGCNTNLGIVLLCAPIAQAAERLPARPGAATLRAAVETVLAELDETDARAAYRAIAQAQPGGLGTAPEQDVRDVPSIGLRAAMTLAADRDRIALQYRDGFAELFEIGLQALPANARAAMSTAPTSAPTPAVAAAVQRVYLAFLARLPDSHIVRKHGPAVAQSVLRAARTWRDRAAAGEVLDADPAFAGWDLALKAAGINPGTSADFTVAALFAAGIAGTAPPAP